MRHKFWFLVRRETRLPYATDICAYWRKDLVRRAEEAMGLTWSKLRKMGFRAEKLEVKEIDDGK